MALNTRTKQEIRVQVAKAWPRGAAGWRLEPFLEAQWAEDVAGPEIGQGEAILRYGPRYLPGVGDRPVPVPRRTDLEGQYIRFLVADESGSIDIHGKKYVADWHGYIARVPRRDGGNADDAIGIQTLVCEGLEGLLDRAMIDGCIEDYDGAEVNPGFCHPVNGIPGGDMGTSAGTLGVRNFDLESGTPWTATEWVRAALKWFGEPLVPPYSSRITGPPWQLDASTLLDFTAQTAAFDGKTVAEVLNYYCNPTSTGLGWRVVVESDVPKIRVSSTARAAITVGGATHPGASTTAVDFDDDEFFENPSVDIEQLPFAAVTGTGARPWVTMSLGWDKDAATGEILPDGWTTGQDPSDEAGKTRRWRVWRIASGWKGTMYGQTDNGLRHQLAATSGDAPDGTRGYVADVPHPRGLVLSTRLPAGEGWTTSASGNREKAVVVVHNGSSWITFATTIAVDGDRIILGSSAQDARKLRAAMAASGTELVVTLGVREWAPLTVSYVSSPDDWGRELPAIYRHRQERLEQWVILANTVKGVASGALDLVGSSDQSVRDDTAVLAQTVAQHAAALAQRVGQVAFATRGKISTDYPPLTVLDPITTGGEAETIGAVVTSRKKHYRADRYRTEWRAVIGSPGIR